ncbi:hypothetical protein K466DRAFT_493648 [Polyporus arcularius HHB13444]|uniref:Ser-Thr-rich glycosyl-phosphatidyl-inositol-anchored membrane family-domain-containing protein n=1 Tax=Polyporus arcularius HHB13444 TaxID=1314778 RepID=A0A5C3P959_9APHY|nr:hypothetical protein K466DRAFT_493648 [Polyporus arcularius HHB13444]
MNLLSILLALAATALATPLSITLRDSVSPPITNPTAQTVWRAGETVTVTWDVAALNGAQPSNPLAKIILGTFANNVEHLMLESPLASGFPILSGNVSLVVPPVPSGSDYIVCLLGTSGDISPAFTIIANDASSSGSATQPQTLAASSSNTLPPHQTGDPSTSVSLPPTGVTRTDPTASSSSTSVRTTTSASVSVTSGILPSGVSGTSGSVTSPGTSASATSTSASSSSAATGAAGNSGSKCSLKGLHLYSVVVSATTLLIFL